MTVGGLGERAGNAPLEDVVMGLRLCQGGECGIDTRSLRDVRRLVARAAGIHAAALVDDPCAYEPFQPVEAVTPGGA